MGVSVGTRLRLILGGYGGEFILLYTQPGGEGVGVGVIK